ncbi:MAG: FecR domain-containing protein [Candidatus Rokubacteria bacterium]|nr:FecR domain-containing protein [Candidatus Rokubacteria bacterium]
MTRVRIAPLAGVALDVLLGAALWAGAVSAQPAESPLTVATISGQVEVYRKAHNAWEPARLRTQIAKGEGARALPGGRLTLRSVGGHALRLAPLSQVFLADDAPAAGAPLALRMDGGRVWVAVLPGVSLRAPLEVQAGPVTVGLRGGAAGLRANGDGSVLLRVYHGVAACSGSAGDRKWERMVKAGEEITVPGSGAPGEASSLTRDSAEAAWVGWNQEQDRAGGYVGSTPTR